MSSVSRRHLLVAPIDWKPLGKARSKIQNQNFGRHLLVAPIDWKLAYYSIPLQSLQFSNVAIYWWRLLIGNCDF